MLASSLFASAAVALRARTGSARLEAEIFEERILDMEWENAEGSLRLRVRRLLIFEIEFSESEPDSEDWADEVLGLMLFA